MTKLSNRFISACGLACILATSACKTTQWQQQHYQAGKTIINADISPDTTMLAYIAPYRQRLQAQMDTVIGQAAQLLPRRPTDGQSLGGNFFADALLVLGKQLDSEVSCSLGTKDGIRIDIAQGDVTVGKIFELMPFENYLTILTISGEDMLRLGKFIAGKNGQPVAGMSVSIKNEELVDMRIQGQPVEPHKNYKLVTYDYLANGGDNIEGIDQPIDRTDTPIRVREGLIDYVKSLSKAGLKVNAERDARIIMVQ